MRITFKIMGNKYVTEDGKELPKELFSNSEFTKEAHMGILNLPDHFNLNVLASTKVIDTDTMPDKKMDGFGNIIVEGNTPKEEPVFFQAGDIAFPNKEDAQSFVRVEFLTALGLVRRTPTHWYHPIFGPDRIESYFSFDTMVQPVEDILPLLFMHGRRKGMGFAADWLKRLSNA